MKNDNENKRKRNNIQKTARVNSNNRKGNIQSKKRKKNIVARRIILIIVIILIILSGVFASKVVMNGGGLKGLLTTLVGQTEETRKNMSDIEFLILGESLNLTDTIMKIGRAHV